MDEAVLAWPYGLNMFSYNLSTLMATRWKMEEVEHITSAARYRSHTVSDKCHSPQLA